VGCVWIVRLCYCGFELAGATLSPTRISHCPDQSSNLHSLAREQGVFLTRPHDVCKNGNVLRAVLKHMLSFIGPWNKWVVFYIMTCISFNLLSSAQPFWVDVLVGFVTQSTYTEPVSTSITFTSLVCWNGLRLLLNVLLLLDCSQLYSVSTVPVGPWGVSLETSVSYQHYWCSVSVDLLSLPHWNKTPRFLSLPW